MISPTLHTVPLVLTSWHRRCIPVQKHTGLNRGRLSMVSYGQLTIWVMFLKYFGMLLKALRFCSDVPFFFCEPRDVSGSGQRSTCQMYSHILCKRWRDYDVDYLQWKLQWGPVLVSFLQQCLQKDKKSEVVFVGLDLGLQITPWNKSFWVNNLRSLHLRRMKGVFSSRVCF